MKRDMELVRRMLMAVEESPQPPTTGDFEMPDESPALVAFHMQLLCGAGYVQASVSYPHGQAYPRYVDPLLTWSGHEFIDSIRSDTVWKFIRQKVKADGGSIPIEIVKQLANTYLKKKLGLE